MRKNIIFCFLFIFVITASTALFSAAPQYILIKKPGQYIRADAVATAKVIAQAKVGDAFRVITLKGSFFEILLPSGEKAYVPVDVATIITMKELAELREKKAPKPAVKHDADPKSKIKKKATKVEDAAELKKRQEAEWLKDKYVQITENKANLRFSPSTEAKILKAAKKWEVFKILSRSKDWFEIFLPPDQKGYVASRLGTVITEEELLSPYKRTGISP
jgi:hypothetical protein